MGAWTSSADCNASIYPIKTLSRGLSVPVCAVSARPAGYNQFRCVHKTRTFGARCRD